MRECLGSLADDLTPMNALTILDHVPEELRGHEALMGLIAELTNFLADILDTWIQSDPPTASEKSFKQQIANHGMG